MKSGTESKLKFKKLKRRLGLSQWQCVGLLESLWQTTIHNAKQGDIGRLSDEDIAADIEWDGDATELIKALVDTGWLDQCAVHRLVVHDWEEHAPNFVKGTLRAANKAFASASLGGTPKDAPKDIPKDMPKDVPKGASSGVYPTKSSQVKSNQVKPNQTKFCGSSEHGTEATSVIKCSTVYCAEFSAVWNTYPKRSGKRVGKKTAFSEWKRIPNSDRSRFAQAVDNYRRHCATTDTIPRDMERFCRSSWWHDWVVPPDPTEVNGSSHRRPINAAEFLS